MTSNLVNLQDILDKKAKNNTSVKRLKDKVKQQEAEAEAEAFIRIFNLTSACWNKKFKYPTFQSLYSNINTSPVEAISIEYSSAKLQIKLGGTPSKASEQFALVVVKERRTEIFDAINTDLVKLRDFRLQLLQRNLLNPAKAVVRLDNKIEDLAIYIRDLTY